MQDNNQEFDLQVRSAMENATEEVPSRVWESIESRLPGRRIAPVWQWSAGLVGALAVALALVLVLRTPSGNSTIHIAPNEEHQTVAEIPAAVPSNPENEEIAPAPKAVAAMSAATAPAAIPAAQTAPATETAAAAEPAPAAQAPQEAAPVAPAPQEAAPATREERHAPAAVPQLLEQSYAEFAEPAKDARRASLDLKGILGSNDKVNSTFNPFNGYYAAPGTTIAKKGVYESSESAFGIPFSVGVGFRIPIAGRLSLGTGLDYSLLTRTFTGSYVDDAGVATHGLEFVNSLSYIGIPVNLYYDLVQSGSFRLYGFAGGEVEKGISNSFRARSKGILYKESVPGLQWSAGAGLGLQYMLTDRIGLFFDPSARYYFDSGQPNSVRTQKPFLFNFEAGFRFDL